MNQKTARARAIAPALPDAQMMFALMHAADAIEKRLEDALEQAGLSMAKFGALSVDKR